MNKGKKLHVLRQLFSLYAHWCTYPTQLQWSENAGIEISTVATME